MDSKNPIPSKGMREQKKALELLLSQLFSGDVVRDKSLDWMKTPDAFSGVYRGIYDSLVQYRGDTKFARKNYHPDCDFVCESKKLIIEYDERQHFSEARKRTLEAYPPDISLCFDRSLWIQMCERIQAKDNDPPNRDEIRAYYDSVRDIEAEKHGYKLLRIIHGQIDFLSDAAHEELINILRKIEI